MYRDLITQGKLVNEILGDNFTVYQVYEFNGMKISRLGSFVFIVFPELYRARKFCTGNVGQTGSFFKMYEIPISLSGFVLSSSGIIWLGSF